MIEQTIRQKLPDGFQTAGFLLEHGMLDLRRAAREPARRLAKLLALHALLEAAGAAPTLRERRAAPSSRTPDDAASARPGRGRSSSSRALERPHTLDYVGFVFDDFLELHGDRLFGRTPRSSAALARLGDLAGDA